MAHPQACRETAAKVLYLAVKNDEWTDVHRGNISYTVRPVITECNECTGVTCGPQSSCNKGKCQCNSGLWRGRINDVQPGIAIKFWVVPFSLAGWNRLLHSARRLLAATRLAELRCLLGTDRRIQCF